MVDKTHDPNEMKRQIQEIMKKNDVPTPPEAIQLIEEALIKFQEGNVLLKDALGFPEDLIEAAYEHGYHLFQSGKYQNGLTVFNLLHLLDSTNPRFVFAIAAAHHYMKNYTEAAGYYMLYETFDSKNPLPYYHLYDCFTKMNQPLLAINALHTAYRLAEQSPEYSKLKGKIEVELRHLASLEKNEVNQ